MHPLFAENRTKKTLRIKNYTIQTVIPLPVFFIYSLLLLFYCPSLLYYCEYRSFVLIRLKIQIAASENECLLLLQYKTVTEFTIAFYEYCSPFRIVKAAKDLAKSCKNYLKILIGKKKLPKIVHIHVVKRKKNHLECRTPPIFFLCLDHCKGQHVD